MVSIHLSWKMLRSWEFHSCHTDWMESSNMVLEKSAIRDSNATAESWNFGRQSGRSISGTVYLAALQRSGWMNTGSITLHMDRRHEVAPVLIARSWGLSVTFMSRVPLMKSHPSSHAHNGSLFSTPRIAATKGRGGPPAFFNMSPTRSLLPPKAWVTGASVQSALTILGFGITCRQAGPGWEMWLAGTPEEQEHLVQTLERPTWRRVVTWFDKSDLAGLLSHVVAKQSFHQGMLWVMEK